MNKCIRYLSAMTMAGALSMFAAIAAADTLGTPGVILSISMNASTSDDFPKYHGYIDVQSKVDTVRYHWGGAYCPGLSLFSDENRFILGALIDFTQSRAGVQPAYKVGQGGNLCVVGVTAAAKK